MQVELNKPAIEGGTPTRDEFLIFGSPQIGPEEIEAVVETLKSSWISTGPKSVAFAKAFREYVGAPHSIATNSCTSALHLCLNAAGVGPGDEVITTPMTFAATSNVIVHQGAKPVFADIEKEGFLIDPAQIERKITKKTKAMVPVHYAGMACDMDRIAAIAKAHKLKLIEDAAHAAGTQYKGRKIGNIGDFTCFSFYVTKNLTTGEGGMVTTADPEAAKMIEKLSLHGLDLDAWQRYSKKGFKHYEIVYPGYKYNMTDIAAALGLCQLRKLDEFIRVREEYARAFEKALGGLDALMLPKDNGVGRHAWHLYPVLVRTEALRIGRDQFIEALHAENIGVGIHYRAIHLQKYYRETYGFKPGDFPNAEFVSDRVISLPLYPKMTPRDVEQTIEAVRKLVAYYRR